MKDDDFKTSVSKLIQAEKDLRARCANFNTKALDAEASEGLKAVIRSKDECIFDLNKIFELLN